MPLTSEELRQRFARQLDKCLDDAILDTAPGWLLLIERALTETEREFAGKAWRVLQVKEKFGELRIYTAPRSEAARRVRDESLQTCMRCGAPADPVNLDGWISTMCVACVTRIPRTDP